MKKVILIAMACLGNSGCMGQNPYPTSGTISTTPVEVHEKAPVAVLNPPLTFNLVEDVAASFTFTSIVPSGDPIVTVKDLPPGASFDSLKNKFSWTPDSDAGHDSAHPDVFQKEYHVQFSLSSTTQPLINFKTVDVLLIVQGVASPMTVEVSTTKMEVQEGQPLTATFTVKSADFPKGPFNLQIDEMPDGAVLTQSDQDPSQFIFNFTPPYDFVTTSDDSDSSGYLKTTHFAVSATGPRAQKVKKTVDLVVHDVRQLPSVSVSDNLMFSYAAEFSVSAEDLNGEHKPSIKVDDPAFGKVTIQDARVEFSKKVKLHRNPVQLSVIAWTGIPATELGKPQQLTLHICSKASYQDAETTHCRVQAVSMTFQGQVHGAPSFDRSHWDAGEVKSMRIDMPISISVPVTDPDSEVAPAVVIEPASMRSQVVYSSTGDGKIELVPSSTGTKVFQLIAKSSFGIETRESFSIRVLPKNWGSMVVLGESPKDAEIKATLTFVKDGQLINPTIDTIDNDVLTLRKSAFVTTSAVNSGLSSGDFGSLLTKISGTLPQVIVSTPLISKFPKPSLPDDLVLAGRFNDLTLTGKPTLNSMFLVPMSGTSFVAAQMPVKLNQSLTAESSNPMTFSVVPNGKCTVLMNLRKDDVKLPVVVECASLYPSGGKILYVGFEWGDLAFDSGDAGLGQTWIQNWLSGGQK